MTELTQEQLAADRAFAAELRAAMARINRRFPVWALADAKTPQDITERSYKMPRDACILYRNRKPSGEDSAHYWGVMKDSDGQTFWVGLWVRTVKGQKVLEIRRVPKTK
jgi:hypothetical protein